MSKVAGAFVGTIHGYRVWMVQDNAGESERYEAFSLVAFDSKGRRVWSEGVRKDRTEMMKEWRGPVESALLKMKG